MGGLLILLGIALPVLAESLLRPEYRAALPLLWLTLAFGLIGFVDDFLITTRGKNLGLKARQKLTLQFLFAIIFVFWLREHATEITSRIGFANLAEVDLGGWYYFLAVFFIVGMSNAINLTDGLDGLVGGIAGIIALAIGAALLPLVAYSGFIAVFAGAVAGGCIGFLWYNGHPARVFMGDTGSLAIGAALAGMAIMGKTEASFQLFAVVPWIEMFSVIIQVAVFKVRARRRGLDFARSHRVFKRTPLHHHFEEIGWKETTVVLRFWLVTVLAIGITFLLSGWK